MERLTERDGSIVYYPHCNNAGKCGGHCSICDFEVKVMNKLADYEDAEETGILLKIPYPLGTTVYRLVPKTYKKIQPITISEYAYSESRLYFKSKESVFSYPCNEIGKTVFLTKEEAEQALAGKKEV